MPPFAANLSASSSSWPSFALWVAASSQAHQAVTYNPDTNELILLMQLYSGRRLFQVLAEQKTEASPLPIYCWLRQLSHELNHLHMLHIFHGDMAARNIMCTDDGKLVLIDFGKCHIAKRVTLRQGIGTDPPGVGTGWRLTDEDEERRMKDLNGFASVLRALLKTQAQLRFPFAPTMRRGTSSAILQHKCLSVRCMPRAAATSSPRTFRTLSSIWCASMCRQSMIRIGRTPSFGRRFPDKICVDRSVVAQSSMVKARNRC